jgi:predicted ATPase with chaperone activity
MAAFVLLRGALPIAIKARESGFSGFILPVQNAREAAIVKILKVYGAGNNMLRLQVSFREPMLCSR